MMSIANPVRALALASASLALSACVSFGPEAPPSLLTLTAQETVAAGATNSGTAATALAIYEPVVSQRINVTRVPVQVDATTVAYLADAVWVEKPARLFKNLLMETVTARNGRMVVEGEDPTVLAQSRLRGNLRRFGYDAQAGAVVVQFDAQRENGDGGAIETRRFERTVTGVPALAGPVGSALNNAANEVAVEVAAWVQ